MAVVILGIEASTPQVSAAIWVDGVILAEAGADSRGRQPLLALVDAALRLAGIERRELGAIAYARGPGAFTGLRVGLSTAKGIAYALQLPLVGVSTLATLAAPFLPAGLVAPLLDAKKGEVYGALYNAAGECVLREQAAPPEDIAERLSELSAGVPVFCVGDGAALVAPYLPATARSLPTLRPRARDVAALGAAALARGEQQDPTLALPTYLRLSEAEVKAQQKTRLAQE